MDLTKQEVAKILGVSPDDVQEWAESGNLPHYQMDGELRFGQEELETWMLSHDDKLENTALNTREDSGLQHFSLYRAISRGGTYHHIEGKSKEDVIRSSVSEIATRFDFDAEVLSELLLDREKLMSTGLGHGVAFPHTRDFFLEKKIDIVTIVFPKEPIDFGSIDHKPVFALFFLLACDGKRHLHLLGKLAHLNHDVRFRDFLKNNPSQHELLSCVKEWERSLIKVPS